MTIDEIRRNPELQADLVKMFGSPVWLHVCLALEQSIHGAVPMNADAIVSVRQKAHEDGQREMLQKLLNLVVPEEAAMEEEIPTYGPKLTPQEIHEALESEP